MKTLWTTIEIAVLIVFALVLFRLQQTHKAAESWQRYSLDCSNRAVVAEAQCLQLSQLLMDQTARASTQKSIVAYPAIDSGSYGGFQQRPAPVTASLVTAQGANMDKHANIAGTLIVLTLFAGIGNLVIAIFLRAAGWWVAKKKITYANAYLSLLFGSLANIVFGFLAGYVAAAMGMMTERDGWMVYLAVLVGGFLIQAGCLSARAKMPLGIASRVTFATAGCTLAVSIVAYFAYAAIMG